MMDLSNESKTLFIPLYGKAIISKKNMFLYDKKAEEIVDSINYDFNSLKQSKWLSMYLSLRSMIIDEIVNDYIVKTRDAVIIQLGCGLDSRVLRINQNYKFFYDIDYSNVINIRRQFYQENNKYRMIGKSVLDLSWMDDISVKSDNVLIVMEGLLMYLDKDEVRLLLNGLYNRMINLTLLFDSYTNKAVRLSKYKNPVNKLGAKVKFGIDSRTDLLKLNSNMIFISEYFIRKKDSKLVGLEKYIFDNLYCGKFSQSLYKIYKYKMK